MNLNNYTLHIVKLQKESLLEGLSAPLHEGAKNISKAGLLQ